MLLARNPAPLIALAPRPLSTRHRLEFGDEWVWQVAEVAYFIILWASQEKIVFDKRSASVQTNFHTLHCCGACVIPMCAVHAESLLHVWDNGCLCGGNRSFLLSQISNGPSFTCAQYFCSQRGAVVWDLFRASRFSNPDCVWRRQVLQNRTELTYTFNFVAFLSTVVHLCSISGL